MVRIKNGKAVLTDTRQKKAVRADNAKRRVTWRMSPVTRVKPSGKIYDRKKLRAGNRRP